VYGFLVILCRHKVARTSVSTKLLQVTFILVTSLLFRGNSVRSSCCVSITVYDSFMILTFVYRERLLPDSL
jgi:hypothetical protein